MDHARDRAKVGVAGGVVSVSRWQAKAGVAGVEFSRNQPLDSRKKQGRRRAKVRQNGVFLISPKDLKNELTKLREYFNNMGISQFGNLGALVMTQVNCDLATFKTFFKRKRSTITTLVDSLAAIESDIRSLVNKIRSLRDESKRSVAEGTVRKKLDTNKSAVKSFYSKRVKSLEDALVWYKTKIEPKIEPITYEIESEKKRLTDKLVKEIKKGKEDPNSAIIVRDVEGGQIITDTNSFASYKLEGNTVSRIDFNDPEVQEVLSQATENTNLQQNAFNLVSKQQNIPDAIDKESLFSILNSIPYDSRIVTNAGAAGSPQVLMLSPNSPLSMFGVPQSNTGVLTRNRISYSYNGGNTWRRTAGSNSIDTEEQWAAYFAYLRGLNQTFTDEGLINALSGYGVPADFKKLVLTNPNLPLQDTNIYRPVEYQGTVYLINTQDSTNSKKISDQSGKLIKANINANAARRLLRAQVAQNGPAPAAEPEAEPGAEPAVEPAVAQLQALAAQAGERRRGRPAGVANTPREAQPRAQGDVNLRAQFDDTGLGNGFTNLPRNDFRRLNVDDAVRLPRAGDRGASARDNMLGRAGRVTDVFSVGPSKIYFIRLNTPDPTTIASINIQPGNRNYVVVGTRSYSLNSPRELMTFLQNRDLAEGLRTSLFKVHLQENPHMLGEIKQLNNMKNLKEEISQEAAIIHTILQTGQDRTQDFINDYNLDGKKLADYVKQYKDSSRKFIIRDIISGKTDPKLETFKKELIKKLKNKMTKEDLKNYIREALKKRLAENQPAPSRETKPGETETIPDKGTEEEKKRRRIGNPNVSPKPKAMNETEQEMVKRIVARYKSKK